MTSAPPYPTAGAVPQSVVTRRQRTTIGLPFTSFFEFGVDSDVLPDPAADVAVVVTNAEGYQVASGSATVSTAPDDTTASFTLTAAQLGQRDLLTIAWTTTVNSSPATVYSTLDVCDSRLFQIADYEAYPELAKANRGAGFTADQYERARVDAEDFLERECGCAFTGRYGTEVHKLPVITGRGAVPWGSGYGYGGGLPFANRSGVGQVTIRQPFIQAIRSLTRTWWTDDGEQTTSLDINGSHLDPFGNTLRWRDPSTGEALWGTITVGLEHGRWVADVRRICCQLARHRLLKGPLDDRATQLSVEGGGVVNLLVPGVRGSITGIPEIDVFIQRYSIRGAIGFVSGA